MTRELKINGIYRHFKGKLYKVLLLANDSETNNDLNPRKVVVYQALYGEQLIWVRDYDMFLSVVDHEKYPEVTQQYRFQELTRERKQELREQISSILNNPNSYLTKVYEPLDEIREILAKYDFSLSLVSRTGYILDKEKERSYIESHYEEVKELIKKY